MTIQDQLRKDLITKQLFTFAARTKDQSFGELKGNHVDLQNYRQVARRHTMTLYMLILAITYMYHF